MSIEETFSKLEGQNKTDLDSIISWMKNANVINEKFTEEQARKMFDIKGNAKVEVGKFKEVLVKAAQKQKKKVEEFHSALKESVVNIIEEAMQAGFDALIPKALRIDD